MKITETTVSREALEGRAVQIELDDVGGDQCNNSTAKGEKNKRKCHQGTVINIAIDASQTH